MNLPNPFLPAMLALAFAGCAAPALQPYYGPDAIRTGTGGTMLPIAGIEVWTHGSPPRKYRILGVLEESGGSQATPHTVASDLAHAAKKAGADGIIILSQGSKASGIDTDTGQFLARPEASTVAFRYER